MPVANLRHAQLPVFSAGLYPRTLRLPGKDAVDGTGDQVKASYRPTTRPRLSSAIPSLLPLVTLESLHLGPWAVTQ